MANQRQTSADGDQKVNDFDLEFAVMDADETLTQHQLDVAAGNSNNSVNTAQSHFLMSANHANSANIGRGVSRMSNTGTNNPFSSSIYPFVGGQSILAGAGRNPPSSAYNILRRTGPENCSFAASNTFTGHQQGFAGPAVNSPFVSIRNNPSFLNTGYGPPPFVAAQTRLQRTRQQGAPGLSRLPTFTHSTHRLPPNTSQQHVAQPLARRRDFDEEEEEQEEFEQEQGVDEEEEEEDEETEGRDLIVDTPAHSPSRRASSRQSRSRWWPQRSDTHPVYPSFQQRRQELGDDAIQLGTGANSGRNRFAIFQDLQDGIPRLAFNVDLVGRGGAHWQGYENPQETYLPAGLSLGEILAQYPNHVWNDGLRLFMAEGWQAETMWRALPSDGRNAGASTRPWNYLQQALGREADKIHEEITGAKRVPEKRQKKPAEEDDEGEQEDEEEDDQ